MSGAGEAAAWAWALSQIVGWASEPRNWRRLTRRDWVELGAFVTRAWHEQGGEIRDLIRGGHPGWADQAEAAADEARRIAGLLEPGELLALCWPDDRAEAALRGQVVRVMAGMSGGCLRSCEHASWERPLPMFAAAWGLDVSCRGCLDLEAYRARTRLQARYCDMCGGSGWAPTSIATPNLGVLTVALGVCDGCVERLASGPPGVA